MKLISWNIDSLNAALTSDSARAQLSRAVIDTLVAENADIIAIQETKLSAKGPTKKHLQILEDYFPDYDNTWRSSVEPARKGYAGTMFLYKKELTPVITYPEIGAPSTMDCEGRIITLEFDNFFVTQVYTPNAGDGLKRLLERQIWDEKYADYLAELDAQKPVLATRKSTWLTLQVIVVHLVLQMKNVLASLTSLPKDSQILTVTSMATLQEPTHGGPNVVKHLKSTIQAGESTTG